MARVLRLAAGLVTLASALALRADEPDVPSPADVSAATSAGADQLSTIVDKTVEQLVRQVRDSVVVITHAGRDGNRSGLGTGFVVSSDGLVATNLHVIGESRPISVQLADGTKKEVVSIHATERALDLAIIRIAADNLTPLELGDSDDVQQGEAVVIVGNPHGLNHSVVSGVVSGRREIDGVSMLQLAIPVESGNSGGPVLDRQGRVQGIVTLKSAVTDNLGFAVAINALKPLLERPNPMAMSRWLNLNALDDSEWTTLFGARWRQRAGRILVDGMGKGFGGRSLSLSRGEVPEGPFEVAVSVRQKQADGAAGLVFHCDGEDKHYGFYPSNGSLRLSRFDGPNVYNWRVLQEVESDHYQADEWNRLKVRVGADKIECFVNDELVITSKDSLYRGGQVGLAKFRHTEAEFRNFRVAPEIPSERLAGGRVLEIGELIADIPTERPPSQQLVESLLSDGEAGAHLLRERARKLEAQAQRLRQLADGVHEKRVLDDLAALAVDADAEGIDLLQGALLIARLDDREVDVDAYLCEIDQMTVELQQAFEETADETARLEALNRYLFEELGFHGSRLDYYNKANSYLNDVIDDREGLPITLSVLYLELARRIGLDIVGVGLPGHFIVRHEPSEGDPQLIDPFDRGRIVSREEAVEKVEAATGQPFQQQYFDTQTNKAILIRMFRNLMGIARQARDPESMLRYVNGILAIDASSGGDRWLRAVLHYNTERIDEALADTEFLLDHPADSVDPGEVRRLRQILLSTQ